MEVFRESRDIPFPAFETDRLVDIGRKPVDIFIPDAEKFTQNLSPQYLCLNASRRKVVVDLLSASKFRQLMFFEMKTCPLSYVEAKKTL